MNQIDEEKKIQIYRSIIFKLSKQQKIEKIGIEKEK